MPRASNPLLGKGELLTAPVEVPRGGGDKNPPYALVTAKKRMSQRATKVVRELDALPETACPDGQAVALLTMHPRYISKSAFPADLINAIGGRSIGSRSRLVKPDQWGIKKHPDEAVTESYFVAAPRASIARWAKSLDGLNEQSPAAATICEVEDLEALTGEDKLQSIPEAERVLLEVALHTAGVRDVVGLFKKHAGSVDAEIIEDRRIDTRGLTFLPVRVDSENAAKLADFVFVRVARGMPQLRPLRPMIARSGAGMPVSLGNMAPQVSTARAVIFDGGIPQNARGALSPAVTYVEPAGIGKPYAPWEKHGINVTSAFLFGPLYKGQGTPQPLCPVDHVRVLDDQSGMNGDLMVLDALKRITDYLDANLGVHQFINLSLGPDLAVEDNDVTAWTAALDERFAGGERYSTIAAGNSGRLDRAAGLCRVQPPSDAVNVISVGACDVTTPLWTRADYSSIGPGRTPGRVKPDGLEFGGSASEEFNMLTSATIAQPDEGTSFASPLVLRTSVAASVVLGKSLGLMALRALMIHRATPHATLHQDETGWGRFESDPDMIATCEDDEVVVVYQGELPIGEHLRCALPMPSGSIAGSVTVGATLVIAPDVDPNNPSTYTRSGLEVFFRPHMAKFRKIKPGEKAPKHAKTRAFFSSANVYGAPESVLRDGAHKWEPCLRHFETMRATSLSDPVFDVYYHSRIAGAAIKEPPPIRYAFVVSLKAPKVPNFYNRVVQTYQGVLVPMQSKVQVQVRV